MISEYINNWLMVIEKMNNENTYKLAWGRSILETIGEKNITKDVTIHFDELSPKIIKYYWNQKYFFNLKQGGNKTPLIEQIVDGMIDEYRKITGSNIPEWFETAETEFKKDEKKYKRIISKVSTVLTADVSWRFEKVEDNGFLLYELDRKNRTISFIKENAKDLYEYRFVLSQLLNYRWAQLLEKFNTAPRIANKVKGLSDNKIRRNNLKKYMNILLKYDDGDPIDFYTGEILKKNDISVDHVIPWSFMYSDDIWNLVLTSKTNNSKKSNNVPNVEDIEKLKERNSNLIKVITDCKLHDVLEEAIGNNYVDKFYSAIKL